MSQRQILVHRITELLSDTCNVAIHAAPGAGKTWVADQVIVGLKQAEVKFVRIDLSTRASGASILRDLVNLVGLTENHKSKHSAAEGDTYEAWGTLTAALLARTESVVLVLEQFDAVLDYPDGLDFLKLIRELIHRPKTTHCNALIASRRSLDAIEAKVRGISTLASVCYSEYLGAVTEEDLLAVWDRGDDLNESERAACLGWSAGHPQLVKYWLSARPDLWPSESSEMQQLETMQRLVAYFDHLGLLSAAAQLVLGPVVDDWLREKRQLSSLGVISAVAGEHIGLGSHVAFRDVLRRSTLDLNPWGVLGIVEVRLRGLVETMLLAEHGDAWTDALIARSKPLKKMHQEASGKLDRDIRQFGHPGSWLAYTYPSDIWLIINDSWDLFRPVFYIGDRHFWHSRFEALARYRNPMAHNRVDVLTADQRLQCRIYAEEILNRIDLYESAAAPLVAAE
ncbi:ATP-binding protein [Kribbella endophytica]